MNELESFLKRFYFIQSLGGLVLGLVMPIMYVVLKNKGLDVFEIGMLILTSALVTIFSEIPCGALSDRIGRKILFILGQLFYFVCCVFIYIFDSFSLLVVAMAFAGVSLAMVSGTLDAVLVSNVKRQDTNSEFLQISLAKAGMYSMLGILVGALLSGVWLDFGIVSSNKASLQENYLFASVLLPIQMLSVFVFIKDEPTERQVHANISLLTSISISYKKVVDRKALSLLMLSSGFAALAFISLEKFWQLEVLAYIGEDKDHWIFGGLFSMSICVGMAGQALSNQLCRAFNNNYIHVMLFIRIMQGALFILLFFVTGLIQFAVVFSLIYFVSALSQSPVMTLFHSEVDEEDRATMLSFRSVFLQLGAAVGIIFSAYISQNYSIETAFLVSGAIYLISTPILLMPALKALGDKLSSNTCRLVE